MKSWAKKLFAFQQVMRCKGNTEVTGLLTPFQYYESRCYTMVTGVQGLSGNSMETIKKKLD